MRWQKKEIARVSGSPNTITCTNYGMLDVSIRERFHHLSNLLSYWRTWKKRFDIAQVV